MSVKIPTVSCPYKEDCGYEWRPRVASPIKCPRCGRRLDLGASKLLKRKEPRLSQTKSIINSEGPSITVNPTNNIVRIDEVSSEGEVAGEVERYIEKEVISNVGT